MASPSGTLYVGMTNNIIRRVLEHKRGAHPGFSKKYGCNKLVWFEDTHAAIEAINRETEIKKWNRLKKQKLIAMLNPKWRDLSKHWGPVVIATQGIPR
jgi:putative endonuclease